MGQEVRVFEFLQDNTKGKPNEDFLCHVSNRVFAVGDGVTRFVLAGNKYPNPSPARAAAKFFCTTARESMVRFFLEQRQLRSNAREGVEEGVRRSFADANGLIEGLNEANGITKETTDYLENDFAGCAGVLGALVEDTLLYYGYIGDCGLMVFDKNYLPILLTQNDLFILEQLREAWGFDSDVKKKLFWRKTVRNRPEARHMTYGILNGEEEALSYVRTGSVRLNPGDTAVLFSDGILPYLFSRHFRKLIAQVLSIQSFPGYSQDIADPTRKSEIESCLNFSRDFLSARGFTNLDDDKAFIALQLA